MENKFTQRCDKAIEELGKIATKYLSQNNLSEYCRLIGKIEGVNLAKGYYLELIKTGEIITFENDF